MRIRDADPGGLDPGIRAFLSAHGGGAPGPAPPAVFDCDGTVIRGDIGEAMFYRQIERFHFRCSPADVWRDHPRRAELGRLYDRLEAVPGGERSSRPAFPDFAEILLAWYFDQIAAGAVVKACVDIVRLLAGHTEQEVRAIADATLRGELASPLRPVRLGHREVPRGVRYLREAVEMLGALREREFEIWAVSGSNRWSVEPVFRPFQIPPGRVIGIALEVRDGVLSDRALEPVPIRAGKVEAFLKSAGRAPQFVASDSKNDIPLLLSSRGLRVRINSRERDTADFFRSAGTEPDGSWVLVESPHTTDWGRDG